MTQRIIKQQRIAKTSASFSSLLLLARFGTVASPAQAQITPDATLGTEASIVDRNVQIRGALGDRIRGGALRGVNHFHSFSDFNVAGDQRVYFSNETNVENIITRVTGGNRSDIFGKLGVDGNANLFLINPNGIVFGQNAQLDIVGSFWAGTSDRVIFSNGESFGTNNPGVPALIEVNIPIGLQMGRNAPSIVRNEANLATGKDLRLTGSEVISDGSLSALQGQVNVEAVAGDAKVQQLQARSATLAAKQNLILENSKLKTTEDLTLKAEDTIRVRDSVAKPIEIRAGKDLLIQGNKKIDILALNHPITPFQAGGNLSLVSNGGISGDAHFTSGGNFSILNLAGQSGSFFSLYDPIIRSNGNVEFGAYDGTSLLVEAAGSIRATGNIKISGPDNASSETVLKNNSALILRSGMSIPTEKTENVTVANPPVLGTIGTAGGATFTKLPVVSPNNVTVQGTIKTEGDKPGLVEITANNGSIELQQSVIAHQNNGKGNIKLSTNNSGDILVKGALTTEGAGTIDIQSSGTLTLNGGSITSNNGETNFNASTIQVNPLNPLAGLSIDGTVNFNKGTVGGGPINGSTSRDTFNFNAGSVQVAVNGGDENDTFNFNGGLVTQTLDGGDGINTIAANKIQLVSPGIMSINSNPVNNNFANIQQLEGIGLDSQLSGTAAAETFTLTSSTEGTVGSFVFKNFTSIDGRDGSDTYNFKDGVVTALKINDTGGGATDNDVLDFTAYQTDPNINLEKIGASGIEEIKGSSTTASTLTGPNQTNNWLLNGDKSGEIITPLPAPMLPQILLFSNFSKLVGGNKKDAFTFTPSSVNITSIDGGGDNNDTIIRTFDPSEISLNTNQKSSISGITFEKVENFEAAGTNKIVNNTGSPQTFMISDLKQGDVSNIKFQGIQAFQGSSNDSVKDFIGNAIFTITAPNTLSSSGIGFTGIKNIGGTTGNNSIINNSGVQTITLSDANKGSISNIDFQNIQALQGSGTDTIVATSGNNLFDINGFNQVSTNGITLSGIQSITAGTGNDTFELNGGWLSGTIDGGDGTNEILGHDALFSNGLQIFTNNDNFVLTTSNQGFVRNDDFLGGIPLIMDFKGIQKINGRGGNNTLTGTPAPETFSVGSSPLAGIQISNINNLDGGGLGDTLQGASTGSVFTISRTNAGSINTLTGLNFVRMSNLVGIGGENIFNFTPGGNISGTVLGGSGNNEFNFNPGGNTTGTVSGGSGTNLFQINLGLGNTLTGKLQGGSGSNNFQFNSGTVSQNVQGGSGDNTFELNGATITGQLIGGDRNNLLRGTNSNDVFQLTGEKSGTVNRINFIGINQADARGGSNNILRGTVENDNFVITDAFATTATGFQAKGFQTINGQAGNDTFTVQSGTTPTLIGGLGDDTVTVAGGTVNNLGLDEGNDSLTIANGNIATADMGAGHNQVSVTGGTIGTLTFGNGLDKLTLGTGNGSIGSVIFGTGDDEILLDNPGTTRSSISSSLTASASHLTVTANDTLHGLPTSPNSISGTGELLVRPNTSTRIAFNTSPSTPNTLTVTPTNLAALKSGFSRVIFAANDIGLETNITTSGQSLQLLAKAGNITGNGIALNTNDGSLLLSASNDINLTNLTIATTTADLSLAASNINLRSASKINSTNGNINVTANNVSLQGAPTPTLGTPTNQLSQPRADRAEIATRSFTPGVASGNLNITTTDLTLDNAALIAETGRGANNGNANNGNVNIAFPNPVPPNAALPNAAPVTPGKLVMKNNSLILAQGDRRTSGDVRITGEAIVAATRATIGQDGNDIITNANPDRGGGAILLESVDMPGKTFKPLAQSFVDAGFLPKKAKPGNTTNDLSSNAAIDLPPPSSKTPTERPTQFVDPNKLVSSGCQPNANKTDRQSQFTIAGKGGLPNNPFTVLRPESTQDDWVMMPESTRPPSRKPEITAQGHSSKTKLAQKLAQKVVAGECVESWTAHHK